MTDRTYLAKDGEIWRWSKGHPGYIEGSWSTLDPATAGKLLILYHQDARNADWFAPRAADLAAELAIAIIEAREQSREVA